MLAIQTLSPAADALTCFGGARFENATVWVLADWTLHDLSISDSCSLRFAYIFTYFCSQYSASWPTVNIWDYGRSARENWGHTYEVALSTHRAGTDWVKISWLITCRSGVDRGKRSQKIKLPVLRPKLKYKRHFPSQNFLNMRFNN